LAAVYRPKSLAPADTNQVLKPDSPVPFGVKEHKKLKEILIGN
jgi:hypothetical protein